MNAATQVAIANYLQISPNQIKEIREWAKVFWVAIHGKRPTFVSKKVASMISLEEAQSIYGDSEAIERNYLNQIILESAYQMAKDLKDAGLSHLVVNSSCSYPATWDVTSKYEDSMKSRQFSVCDRIAAHLISANLI